MTTILTIIFFGLGLIIGSFLNVVILRFNSFGFSLMLSPVLSVMRQPQIARSLHVILPHNHRRLIDRTFPMPRHSGLYPLPRNGSIFVFLRGRADIFKNQKKGQGLGNGSGNFNFSYWCCRNFGG